MPSRFYELIISVHQVAVLPAQDLQVVQVLEVVRDQVVHHRIRHRLAVRLRGIEQREGILKILSN